MDNTSSIPLLEGLRDTLQYTLQPYVGSQQLDMEFIFGLFEAFCLDAATRYVARGYSDIQNLPQGTIKELEQNLHALLRVSDDQPRTTGSTAANESQSRREINPEPSSPPDDFDPETMPTEDECPICYRRRATKGFTRCQHKICPHCMDGLLNESTTISCPLCRQGEPQDVDMREVTRRMEQIPPRAHAQGTPHENYADVVQQPQAHMSYSPIALSLGYQRYEYETPYRPYPDNDAMYHRQPVYHHGPHIYMHMGYATPPPPPPLAYDYYDSHGLIAIPPPFLDVTRYGYDINFERIRGNTRRVYESARQTIPMQVQYGHEDIHRMRRDIGGMMENSDSREYSGRDDDREYRRRHRYRRRYRY